jgi:hypothetical protein
MAIKEADLLPAGADPKHVAAVIDRGEFEKDQQDAEWRKFIQASQDHLETLEQDGRSRH